MTTSWRNSCCRSTARGRYGPGLDGVGAALRRAGADGGPEAPRRGDGAHLRLAAHPPRGPGRPQLLPAGRGGGDGRSGAGGENRRLPPAGRRRSGAPARIRERDPVGDGPQILTGQSPPKLDEGSPQKDDPSPQRTRGLPKKTEAPPKWTRGLPKRTTPLPKRTRGLPERTTPLPKETEGSPKKTKPHTQWPRLSPKKTTLLPKETEGSPKKTKPRTQWPRLSPKKTDLSPKETGYSPASGRIRGNRITSRIDCRSVSSMVRRSIPMPMPAAGGIACSRART